MPRYLTLIVAFALASAGTVFAQSKAVDKTGQQFLTEMDLDLLVDSTVTQLLEAPVLEGGERRLAMFRLRNKTKDHVDGMSILERIGTELIRSQAAIVVERQRLVDIAREQALSQTLSKRRDGIAAGKLAGADYLLEGQLTEVSKKAGTKKQIYYALNLKMIDVHSSEVVFATAAEVKKKAKRSLTDILGVK